MKGVRCLVQRILMESSVSPDLFVGVPVVLGSGGVQRVIELELTDEERTQLNKSASSVKTLIEKALI